MSDDPLLPVRAYALAMGPVLDLIEQAAPVWDVVVDGINLGHQIRAVVGRVASGWHANNPIWESTADKVATPDDALLAYAADAAIHLSRAEGRARAAVQLRYDRRADALRERDEQLDRVHDSVVWALQDAEVDMALEIWEATLADAKRSLARG